MRKQGLRSRGAAATLDDMDILDEGPRSLRARVFAVLRQRPLDTFGVLLMLALGGTVVANALYLQTGKHPSPMRAPGGPSPIADTTGSLVAVPRPRPADAASPAKEAAATPRPRAQVVSDIQKELARRGFYDGPMDGLYGPRMEAALRDFEQASSLKVGSEPGETMLQQITQAPAKIDKRRAAAHSPRRPAPALATTASSSRVLAVQRALSEYGYGQIKTSGVYDDTTKAAIEKFERDRKLPVSGQVSDRVMRELAAVTGRALE